MLQVEYMVHKYIFNCSPQKRTNVTHYCPLHHQNMTFPGWGCDCFTPHLCAVEHPNLVQPLLGCHGSKQSTEVTFAAASLLSVTS